MKRDKRRNDTKSIRKTRKASRRSIVQSLACLVVFCTTYALILPAITLERPTYCGIKEHTHSDKCYTMQLVCGQEEGEGHTHDDSCYTEHQNLICGLEESEGHTHTDECYQTYDNLICELEENEEHTHGPECYEQVTELVCPLEETEGHTHTEACYETVRELSCALEESKGHTHTEKCYEKVLTCKKEEHEHSLQCYADPKADLETQAQWEETLPKKEELTGVWAEDLLKVAESQLDYKESDRNYQVVDEEPMGYTRYGAYLGMPYEDWCAMFIEFCLHYADIPKEDMPRASSCSKWEKLLTKNDMFLKAENGRPEPGDLVFFDIDEYEGPDHVGIVTEVDEKDGIKTIEGNCGNKVAHREYKWDDKTLYGYGLLPENPNPEGTEKTAEEEAPQATVEFTAETETMTVRVEAPEGAFPEGTTMEVKTVAAEDVMDAVTDAVDGEIAHVDAVDITFFHEGKEIEPALPIQVFMQPKENNQEGTPTILHLQNDGTTEPMENKADSENSEETVQFEADSFSVYALVYTVDFHWEVDGKTYELSLPGGSYVSLEQLFEALAASEKKNEAEVPQENALALNDVEVSTETKKFTAEVETVEFTDPSLLWVGKIENDTTVGALKEAQHLDVQYSADLTEEQIATMDAQAVSAGDWALISLQAFDTEEYLTVTMKNGDQFKIKVTDSNFASTVDGKTFALLISNGAKTQGYALDANVRGDGRLTSRQTNINYLGETVNEEVYFCDNIDSIKWTFEYIKGSGNQFKLKANNGQYLHYENGQFSLSNEPTILYADVTPGDNDHVRLCLDEGLHNAINLMYGGNNGFGIYGSGNNDPNEKFTLCKPFDMNSNTPGTISTVDNNVEGIELKLFDYDYITTAGTTGDLDKQGNKVEGKGNNSHYNSSVNQGKKLWFLGWGADSNENTPGINDFTGLGDNIRALQGIVQNNLVDGYPVLAVDQNGNATDESLNYLFDGTAADTKTYTANRLFEKIGDKYSYDSNKHYAEFNTSTRNFTVYDGTLEQNSGSDKNWAKNDKAVGFFPFDKYSDMKGLYDNNRLYLNPNISENDQRKANGQHYRMNHHNGMSLDAHFRIPESKQDSYGNDIEFEFSGDDDLWVYIDDVLVLDIGGVHQPLNGKINFTTGAVSVDKAVAADGRSNSDIAGANTTIEEMFRKAGKTYDPNKLHEIKVFWIERGGCDSNCKIEFNLPLTTTREAGAIQFDKVSAKNESLKLQGAVFTLYTDATCTTPLVIGNQPVTATSNEDGTVNFYAIPTGTYYIKETAFPEGYQAKNPEEIFTATVTKDTTVHPLKEGAEQATITNEPKKTEVQVEKLWKYKGQDVSAPDGASITITLGRYKLDESPTAQGKGTLVIKDSYTGLPSGSNYDVTYTITGPDNYSKTIHKVFSDSEKNIEISVPKMPAGADYTVTKRVAPIAAYAINNGTGTVTKNVPKNGSVDAQFGGSAFSRNAYSITVKSIDRKNNQTTEYTWLAPTYYPVGSNVYLQLSYPGDNVPDANWKRQRRFEYSFDNQNYRDFTINNANAGWQGNQTGTTNGFSVDQDKTIYVRYKETADWDHTYDWFQNPKILGANPISTNSVNSPRMMAMGLRASSAVITNDPPSPPDDPPTDTIYELDTEYGTNPDTITLNSSSWTGRAGNLEAYNEYGKYVYFIASVSETGVPEGTEVVISGETFQDGDETVLTVTNNLPSGYLKVHKTVTYNGESPATDAQKQALAGTYTFKVYTNEGCTTPYQTPQGNEVTLTVTIGNDGVAKDSTTVELPVGNYWIKEENPTQTGVTPDHNNILVVVTQGNESNPAVVDFVNNKEESNNPDEMAIDIEKTFTGITKDQIPEGFHPVLQYRVPGSDTPVSVELGVTSGNVTLTKSGDELTWHWHVKQIPTNATNFTISEQNYSITGYDRTTYINGGSNNVEDPSIPQTVTVLVPTIDTTKLNPTSDYTTSDRMKVFVVGENQILLVRMTNNATTVVSQKSLSLATRTALERMLKNNSYKIPGGAASAEWKTPFVYYSKEVHGNQFSYGGRTIYFEGDTVKVPHKSSSQEARVDIEYTSGSQGNNSFTLQNDYTEQSVDIDVVKVDQKNTSKRLGGAEFTLRKIQNVEPAQGGTIPSDDSFAPQTKTTGTTGDATGLISFTGLTHGYYELTETKAPDGYVNASEIIVYFKVEDGAVKWLTKGTGTPSNWTEKAAVEEGKVTFTAAADATHEAKNAKFTIKNEPGIELPHTGGRGTQMFTFSGLILMAAVTLLYGYSLRRRRKGGR